MTPARTSAEAAAPRAASASSAVTWSFSALTFGRFSRMVPMPSATSRETNSPRRQTLAKVAGGHAGRRLGVGDQAELGPAVQQRVLRQDPHRVAERSRLGQRPLAGGAHHAADATDRTGGRAH